MARELKKSDLNEMTIFDVLSGTKIKLFYKTPTTSDRILYQSAILNLLTKTQKIESMVELQMNWAEKFLMGFRKGDFTLDEKEISSDAKDKDFYNGWFGVVKETAGDILLVFIKTLFGESSYVIKDEPRPFLPN
ncbi:MAG: hypothetical protein WC879_03395 [Melioribacteraceae bacterium]